MSGEKRGKGQMAVRRSLLVVDGGGDPLERWVPALDFKRPVRVFRDGFEPAPPTR